MTTVASAISSSPGSASATSASDTTFSGCGSASRPEPHRPVPASAVRPDGWPAARAGDRRRMCWISKSQNQSSPGSKAADDRMPGLTEMGGRVLRGRGVAAADMPAGGAAAQMHPPTGIAAGQALHAPGPARGHARIDNRRLSHPATVSDSPPPAPPCPKSGADRFNCRTHLHPIRLESLPTGHSRPTLFTANAYDLGNRPRRSPRPVVPWRSMRISPRSRVFATRLVVLLAADRCRGACWDSARPLLLAPRRPPP